MHLTHLLGGSAQFVRFLIPITVFSILGRAAAAEKQVWTIDSFRQFSEGAFSDSGVNLYAAADGTVRLINAFDFNRDGLPDIFLPSNGSDSSVVDLSIYWDKPGYDPKSPTRLPTEGGKDAAVADLNRDGWPDLVVVNDFDGTKNELNAYIYWGSAQGFSPERRSTLPTQGAQGVAIADLNNDGFPEIVVANSGLTYHVAIDKIQQSYLYWNRNGKFSADDRTVLPTINGRDVAIADLNADGAPDLVFACGGNERDEAGARIFWSTPEGYSLEKSQFLPGESTVALAIGDLDRDGRPDLVLVNAARITGREGGIYTLTETTHLDSYLYFNSSDGFSVQRRVGLPTVSGSGAAIADVDNDGWPDVIFSNTGGDASFVYWGSADGFTGRHRLALPTQSARAVAAADLNHDGHIDLIFANSQDAKSYDTVSYLYWGSPDGFTVKNRLELPTSGAGAIVVADLANRQRNDLVFINTIDSLLASATPSSLYYSDRKNPDIFSARKRILLDTRGLDAYSAADLNLDGLADLVIPDTSGVSLYWANPSGFDSKRSTRVTYNYAFSTRVADFNRDGYLDLLLSEWRPGSSGTHIYYGGPQGFSSAHRTLIPVGGIRFHTIADFNGDGWIDVAYPVFNEQKVSIFWNGPDGFSPNKRLDLPGRSPVTLEVADLNGDGFLDLIVPNLFDINPPPENKTRAFGGSPKGDVFLYWGSAEGYSNERRTILPALGAEDAVVADLNRDGKLDLVITAYHGGTRRDFPSYVYWQGKDGFDPRQVTMLETYSASGALAADYNGDGWPDLLFANHHRDGSHRNRSFLYWGGPSGFSKERRLELPADGPHLLTAMDAGNIFDRSDDYDYISPAREFKGATHLLRLKARGQEPAGTRIRFQVRSAETREGLATASWQGPGSHSAFFEMGGKQPSSSPLTLNGHWVQFRARFSNPGGGLPVLESISLELE